MNIGGQWWDSGWYGIYTPIGVGGIGFEVHDWTRYMVYRYFARNRLHFKLEGIEGMRILGLAIRHYSKSRDYPLRELHIECWFASLYGFSKKFVSVVMFTY
ncbi:MAG: hypothetical protein QW570_07805 [Candidatus Caldarchaeum sp.]